MPVLRVNAHKPANRYLPCFDAPNCAPSCAGLSARFVRGGATPGPFPRKPARVPVALRGRLACFLALPCSSGGPWPWRCTQLCLLLLAGASSAHRVPAAPPTCQRADVRLRSSRSFLSTQGTSPVTSLRTVHPTVWSILWAERGARVRNERCVYARVTFA